MATVLLKEKPKKCQITINLDEPLDLNDDIEVLLRIINALDDRHINSDKQMKIQIIILRKTVEKKRNELVEGQSLGGYNHNDKDVWYKNVVNLR